MKILVIGGTRFFGIHTINELIAKGHEVIIANRGITKDDYGDKVTRIIFDRCNVESIKKMLRNTHYDVVIDKLAYCSKEIKILLDNIDVDKYILMSSTAVYEPKHWNTKEEEFDATKRQLIWCSRMDFPYDKIKRQAECALWQEYKGINAIAVRYPFVLGKDDYTRRLLFYIENTIKKVPMNIDNIDNQMSFIDSVEAGKFMAFLVDKNFVGPINGCSDGTISIREILDYIDENTGIEAIINKDGATAPYNSEPEYSINNDKAKNLGFEFTSIKSWIFKLIDYYIEVIFMRESISKIKIMDERGVL